MAANTSLAGRWASRSTAGVFLGHISLGRHERGLESSGVDLLEGDQAAGELEQGEVVLVLLRPADEQRAVAVEPRVAGLDDPAPGPPAGVANLRGELLTAGADVGLEALADGEFADVVVVVAAVETEPLGV